jgi:hypothetical protein
MSKTPFFADLTLGLAEFLRHPSEGADDLLNRTTPCVRS